MRDHRTLERIALAALTLTAAAAVVAPAGAKPTPSTSTWSVGAHESPTVVPYLSHGIGVDERRVAGGESTGRSPDLVVPYLSHGIGVDESRFTVAEKSGREQDLVVPYLSHGIGVDERQLAGTVSVSEAPAGGDAWYDWSVAGIAGGAAFAALVLAAAGTLTYRSRHERTATT